LSAVVAAGVRKARVVQVQQVAAVRRFLTQAVIHRCTQTPTSVIQVATVVVQQVLAAAAVWEGQAARYRAVRAGTAAQE
jgi:hypothetical protein